jgi:hypothetical protein
VADDLGLDDGPAKTKKTAKAPAKPAPKAPPKAPPRPAPKVAAKAPPKPAPKAPAKAAPKPAPKAPAKAAPAKAPAKAAPAKANAKGAVTGPRPKAPPAGFNSPGNLKAPPENLREGSVKHGLYAMFLKVGTRKPASEVMGLGKPSTVSALLADLKNPDYTSGPLMWIVRDGDDYVRRA